MYCKNFKISCKHNSSNDFTKVNRHETLSQKTSLDSDTYLYPGEFPFCGNCIHYPGSKVCPIARVSVDSTSDGTGCIMIGVYKKKSNAIDSVM